MFIMDLLVSLAERQKGLFHSMLSAARKNKVFLRAINRLANGTNRNVKFERMSHPVTVEIYVMDCNTI